MNDAQIKHMVNRFLAWKLPENFSPDAGISFEPKFNVGTSYEGRHEPIGTNLFDAIQTEAMVRHMIDGLPAHVPAFDDGKLKALEACITHMQTADMRHRGGGEVKIDRVHFMTALLTLVSLFPKENDHA